MRNFNKFLETRTWLREKEKESLNYTEEIIRIFHWCTGIHNKLKEKDDRKKRPRERNVFL